MQRLIGFAESHSFLIDASPTSSDEHFSLQFLLDHYFIVVLLLALAPKTTMQGPVTLYHRAGEVHT